MTITPRDYASLRAEIEKLVRFLHEVHPDTPITDATHLGTNVPIHQGGKIDTQRQRDGNDIGFDLLDAIETIMSLEDHFGFIISEAEEENCNTFGQLVDLIATKAGIAKPEKNHG